MEKQATRKRICLICEGSYPYVAGGVSTWIQMLVEQFSEYDFVIWSIATNRREMNEYKYNLPANLLDIRTVYLEDYPFKPGPGKQKLTENEREALKALVLDEDAAIAWQSILDLIQRYRLRLVDVLMGEAFFSLAVDLYQKEYSRTVFNDYLWNLRSMYFPLMKVLADDFPAADLYHAVSTGYAGLIGSVTAHVTKKPLIITEHGIYTREREEEIIKAEWVIGDFKMLWIRFFYKLARIAYLKADRVIALFEHNRNLQIELGCPLEKTQVIPNGVDLAVFATLPEPERNRASIRVGAVVRVVPIKDIKTMLLAFDHAQKQVPQLELVICGPLDEDLEYARECQQLLAELGTRQVSFAGRVQVRDHLAGFDLMLLTSISEGQPLAVMEGMAAGIAQVATHVGACQELLLGTKSDDLGEAGRVVPVMDVERISQAIVELARNPSLRRQMGLAGQKRMQRLYQKNDFLRQYQELYAQWLTVAQHSQGD
ncbi:MAG: GT4 family glycosyltransferase PelF [Eubacteriales bacterium]|nr:GT4 family glycosyltransferase PelF [Eubacteriales bacterium]